MESLTKKQEKLCDEVFEEYDHILNTHPKPKLAAIKAWMAVGYGLYDLPVPTRIEIVASPYAAMALAAELTKAPCTSMDDCGISESGWVAFYDYFNRIKILTDEEAKDVLALRDFQRCCWDSIFLDECAIVVAFPTTLKRDGQGNLHSSKGPCIKWGDGHQDFAWHGVWVPEKLIMAPKSYTAHEYKALSTEHRRALGEHAGWTFVVELLGTKCVDTWVDPNTQLTYELHRAANTVWLRKQSPRLQNNKQPYYFEPVHEDLETAQAARKWQAARTLTVAQCHMDPVLTYDIET